jgi:hypothetical protein
VTRMRVPRMTGLPLQTAGSISIRSWYDVLMRGSLTLGGEAVQQGFCGSPESRIEYQRQL